MKKVKKTNMPKSVYDNLKNQVDSLLQRREEDEIVFQKICSELGKYVTVPEEKGYVDDYVCDIASNGFGTLDDFLVSMNVKVVK